MKFNLIRCTACNLKCLKAVPVINDYNLLIKRFNKQDCITFRKGEGIRLKTSLYARNISIKPNDKCFCGSNLKFKKCCMLKIEGE